MYSASNLTTYVSRSPSNLFINIFPVFSHYLVGSRSAVLWDRIGMHMKHNPSNVSLSQKPNLTKLTMSQLCDLVKNLDY